MLQFLKNHQKVQITSSKLPENYYDWKRLSYFKNLLRINWRFFENFEQRFTNFLIKQKRKFIKFAFLLEKTNTQHGCWNTSCDLIKLRLYTAWFQLNLKLDWRTYCEGNNRILNENFCVLIKVGIDKEAFNSCLLLVLLYNHKSYFLIWCSLHFIVQFPTGKFICLVNKNQ